MENRMFTLRCTTCEARLGVKDETLIGQILACPKCGSMVHVVPPDASPREPGTVSPEPGPQVPAPIPILAPLPPPLPDLGPSESELRLRKILLAVLAGFVLFLVVAIGILFVAGPKAPGPQVPAPDELQPPPGELQPAVAEPEKPGPQVPAPGELQPPLGELQPAVAEPEEPEYRLNGEEMPDAEDPGSQVPALGELRPAVADEEEPAPDVEIRTTTDLLADLERKLPGLVETSAALMIDVPDRLQLPLGEFKLDQTPLVAALRTLSRLTEVPITLDVDEFRCRGIDFNAPISGTYKPGTVGETLIALLSPLGLEPVIEDRQILVTLPQEERDQLIEMTFDVTDLADSDEDLSPEYLAEIVRRLVDPIGFSVEEPTDDQPTLKIDGTTLIVKHRKRILDETLRLLEQLRMLRQLPQKIKIEDERLVPEVFGWDAVRTPLTLNYYLPISLGEVFPQLEAAANIRILVDHKALNRALSPFSSLKGTVGSDRGTVDTALEKLLASVEGVTLTYRIIDVAALEVTTRDVAGRPEKMSVEVHRYDILLEGNETPEEFVQTIRAAVERGTWYDADNPETLGLGDIVIDKPSGCLIVRQSQSVQRQLRRWIQTQTE